MGLSYVFPDPMFDSLSSRDLLDFEFSFQIFMFILILNVLQDFK